MMKLFLKIVFQKPLFETLFKKPFLKIINACEAQCKPLNLMSLSSINRKEAIILKGYLKHIKKCLLLYFEGWYDSCGI